MHRPMLRRTIARLSRCLSAAALALTLATVVLPSATPPVPPPASDHRYIPQVNWNS
jgi:hypothetical protein